MIGYDQAAEIAKRAFATGKGVREIALEMEVLPEDELDRGARPVPDDRGRHPRLVALHGRLTLAAGPGDPGDRSSTRTVTGRVASTAMRLDSWRTTTPRMIATTGTK